MNGLNGRVPGAGLPEPCAGVPTTSRKLPGSDLSSFPMDVRGRPRNLRMTICSSCARSRWPYVQPIPCVPAVAGFQQPRSVVVIEGPDRHTGEFGKLASLAEPGQTWFHVR